MIATKKMYLIRLTDLYPELVIHKNFKLNQEEILNELEKLQLQSKEQIENLIKEIINNKNLNKLLIKKNIL